MGEIRYRDELEVRKAGRSLVVYMTKALKKIGCEHGDTVIVTVEGNKIIIERKGFEI